MLYLSIYNFTSHVQKIDLNILLEILT